MSKQTRDRGPGRKTMAGGPAGGVRDGLEKLISETRELKVRTDKSLKDVAQTVERISSELRDVDSRAAEALKQAAEAMKSAQGKEIGVRFDELTAEMRATVSLIDTLGERMSAMEAAGQRPAQGALDADRDFMGAIERSAAFARWKEGEFGMLGSVKDARAKVPSLFASNIHVRAASPAPVIDDSLLGSSVLDVYRPGIIIPGRWPMGLINVINRGPSFTGDTLKYIRKTQAALYGGVATQSTAAVAGGTTPVSEIVVDSVLGFMVGETVRIVTAAGFKEEVITAIDSANSKLQFGTNEIDFDIAAGDLIVCDIFGATPEGDQIPGGVFETELLSAEAKNIATYLTVTKWKLKTIPGLQSVIQTEVIDNAQWVFDRHLLYGDNSTKQLRGFFTDSDMKATVKWSEMGAGQTRADTALKAASQIPSAAMLQIVMHQSDWHTIVQAKAEDGHYIHTSYGPVRVIDVPGMRALGPYPVTFTAAMKPADGLVMDAVRASEFSDNGTAESEAGYYDKGILERKLTFVYEEGAAHGIKDPNMYRMFQFDGVPS